MRHLIIALTIAGMIGICSYGIYLLAHGHPWAGVAALFVGLSVRLSAAEMR